MHKVLIVEDFPDDARLLSEELTRYAERRGLELSIETSPVAMAIAAGSRTFDLIFLDIELPGINGIEAAELLRAYDTSTPVIFTTSLAQYAVRGYEVGAAGFIVKPVTQPKLELAMDKVLGRLRATGSERIVIPTSGGVRVIPVRDVCYVELVRHDLVFHLSGGEEPIRVRGTIRQVTEHIRPEGPLLQISSGCVVNMDYVQLIKGSEVQMTDGAALPLSRARRREAIESFSSYLGGTL